jgi:hypothetical protein
MKLRITSRGLEVSGGRSGSSWSAEVGIAARPTATPASATISRHRRAAIPDPARKQRRGLGMAVDTCLLVWPDGSAGPY